ncbi:hypothetical protein H7170_00295 [Candidatus Gracilibacteria bacterium]|nr:hypothetical protein [Candidatus Gracilibacteria bacterium]
MFAGRKLIIATKHKKETVMAPILEKELGVKCFIDESFDTDILGTFTGEIERKGTPIATLREKCIRAMKANNCDLGVASEGSFGSHPLIPFIHADDEGIIFIDSKNNIEIIAREISMSTNLNGKEIKNQKELTEFSESTKFPSHALILRKSRKQNTDIYKGITEKTELDKIFDFLFSKYGSVYIETDMRAMYNPSRMLVIQKATENLIEKIKSLCPHCQMPGWGVTDVIKGLECSLCGNHTDSILSYIYECTHCHFKKEEMYPHKKTTEEPTYCGYCNP